MSSPCRHLEYIAARASRGRDRRFGRILRCQAAGPAEPAAQARRREGRKCRRQRPVSNGQQAAAADPTGKLYKETLKQSRSAPNFSIGTIAPAVTFMAPAALARHLTIPSGFTAAASIRSTIRSIRVAQTACRCGVNPSEFGHLGNCSLCEIVETRHRKSQSRRNPWRPRRDPRRSRRIRRKAPLHP